MKKRVLSKIVIVGTAVLLLAAMMVSTLLGTTSAEYVKSLSQKLDIKATPDLALKYYISDSNPNTTNGVHVYENAENIDTYLTSLQWALYNSKSIKNIAISGPYGAGKSSIIDTYIKKNRFNHKYLKVSLATFQDISSEKLDLDNEEKIKEKIDWND